MIRISWIIGNAEEFGIIDIPVGYRVNADMPGDDRPETVADFATELFGRAGLGRPD